MSSSSEGDDVELARGVGEGRLPAPSSSQSRLDSLRSVDLSSSSLGGGVGSEGGEHGPVDNVRSAVLASRTSSGGGNDASRSATIAPKVDRGDDALTADAAPDAETFSAWSAGDYHRREREGDGLVVTASDDTNDGTIEGYAENGRSGNATDGGDGERLTVVESRMRSFVGPTDATSLHMLRSLRRRKRARAAALLGRHDDSVLTAPGRDLSALRASAESDMGRQSVKSLDSTSRGDERARIRRNPYGDVDYTPPDSAVWHNFARSLHDPDHPQRRRGVTYIRRILAGNWLSRNTSKREGGRHVHPVETYVRDTTFVTRLVVLFVGLAMSVSGYAVQLSSDYLLEFKVGRALSKGGATTDGYAVFVLLSLLYGLLAYVPVACRPLSAGSGGFVATSCPAVEEKATNNRRRSACMIFMAG